MPEGHTIHTIARDQAPLLVGRSVRVSSPQGRFAESAALLDARVLEAIEPYGKHLFYWWAGGHGSPEQVLHVHLGLFGRFRLQLDQPAPAPRGAVRLRLATDDVTIDLAGPTACELGPPELRAAIIERLGPDPLRSDADPKAALERIGRSRAPLGALLLDQSVIAGVGNVFRAEALFVHGIHPTRPGRSLSEADREQLWATIARMLRQGVKDNRILTVHPDEVGARSRSRVPRSQATYVYKRDLCLRCGTPIERVALAGRSCYFCPRCQPA